jgi:hypothetical protein
VQIPQHLLDIETRVRTNLFPWRGQFSPGLVDILLSTYASPGNVAFDPFAGVGTTLMEAARQGISCLGSELSPAAVAMAETVVFVSLRKEKRKEWLNQAKAMLDQAFDDELPLFGGSPATAPNLLGRLAKVGRSDNLNKYVRNIITNILIRIADDADITEGTIYRAFKQHAKIIENLPYSASQYAIENTDARCLSLKDEMVDFVVTSPPYLNVFNYHQNNRPAMELLGWDVLRVAKSEFGANRKHRGNRFLTVVQYCLDMQGMLLELRRVMKRSGRAVFIVGRESCIRGVPFRNGAIVTALAEFSGFRTALKQERKFKNKFGVLIYEDVLHFLPTDNRHRERGKAVSLAIDQLRSQLKQDLDEDVRKDLRDAIEGAWQVNSSPIYRPI